MTTTRFITIGIFLAVFFALPAYSANNNSNLGKGYFIATNEQIIELGKWMDSLQDRIDTVKEFLDSVALQNKNADLSTLVQKNLEDTIASIHEEIYLIRHQGINKDVLISSN
jgi:hypothetical protein